DLFLGLNVPEQRKIAKKYKELSINDLQELLNSKFHEHRLIALLILIEKYNKLKKDIEKKQIIDFYLKNTKNINNWDLVDLSCHKILGDYLLDKDRTILYKLAKSSDLWEKRISIISTFAFINNKEYETTFKIAEILLNDRHDLIHKAVGWMLREIGKRISIEKEEEFLKKYYKKMPRTMLRYAIERFDEKKRKYYLKKDTY
ncbi:MAG: DNA alkylation repair protein, partial [Candidatus Woesearchaeota archaeon]